MSWGAVRRLNRNTNYELVKHWLTIGNNRRWYTFNTRYLSIDRQSDRKRTRGQREINKRERESEREREHSDNGEGQRQGDKRDMKEREREREETEKYRHTNTTNVNFLKQNNFFLCFATGGLEHYLLLIICYCSVTWSELILFWWILIRLMSVCLFILKMCAWYLNAIENNVYVFYELQSLK